MYRVLLIGRNTGAEIPYPPGEPNKDYGKLFERKKDAIRYAVELSNRFPDDTWTVREWGPVSQLDWLMCNACNTAVRRRTVTKLGGCPSCNGMQFLRNGDPPWWKRLVSVIRKR